VGTRAAADDSDNDSGEGSVALHVSGLATLPRALPGTTLCVTAIAGGELLCDPTADVLCRCGAVEKRRHCVLAAAFLYVQWPLGAAGFRGSGWNSLQAKAAEIPRTTHPAIGFWISPQRRKQCIPRHQTSNCLRLAAVPPCRFAFSSSGGLNVFAGSLSEADAALSEMEASPRRAKLGETATAEARREASPAPSTRPPRRPRPSRRPSPIPPSPSPTWSPSPSPAPALLPSKVASKTSEKPAAAAASQVCGTVTLVSPLDASGALTYTFGKQVSCDDMAAWMAKNLSDAAEKTGARLSTPFGLDICSSAYNPVTSPSVVPNVTVCGSFTSVTEAAKIQDLLKPMLTHWQYLVMGLRVPWGGAATYLCPPPKYEIASIIFGDDDDQSPTGYLQIRCN
jgi:hypothetical protein